MGKRYGQGYSTPHDHERKVQFGLTAKDKWPDEGMGVRRLV